MWLVVQLTSTLAVPTIVWSSMQSQSECQCGHGAGAICPMHKHNVPKDGGCVLRSGAPDTAATVLSFLSPIGLEPVATRANLARATVLPTPFIHHAIDRPVTPDLPPPRA
jgi:hypothetical protein